MVVEGIWLDQINNVESVVLTSFGVRDTEVVPLSVSSCVVIRLQDQIIFVLINLDSSS